MTQPFRDLSETLARELALAEDYERLLTRENEVLRAGHADRLPELTARKAEIQERLQAAAAVRRSLVAGGARRELEQACMTAGERARALMDRLVGCAQRAQDLSERNLAIVAKRLQQVQQSLSVLMQADPSATITYAPNGLARASVTRRTRGIA